MQVLHLAQLLFGYLFLLLATPASAGDSKLVQELLNSEGAAGPIHLTDKTFSKIVNGPREYDILVLLTAVAPQYGCTFCRMFDPHYETVAKSWHKAHKKLGDGLVFATADISKNNRIFKELQLTQAPNLWIYKKTGEVIPYTSGYTPYQYPQIEEQAEGLAEFIRQELGHRVTIEKPVRYDKALIPVAAVVVIVPLVKLFWRQILTFLRSAKLWVAVTLVSVLLFTSGHMFNTIRRVPYIAGDGKGGVTYFVGGHSNQVAIETQIIAGAYALMAFSTILLVTKIPVLKNSQAQNVAVLVFTVITFVGMSFVISKFQIKNGGYPYSLLKL